jgi:hypothetical protein
VFLYKEFLPKLVYPVRYTDNILLLLCLIEVLLISRTRMAEFFLLNLIKIKKQ